MALGEMLPPEVLPEDYPLPDLDDPVMAPFWAGARAGRLLQQRDRLTGRVCWPPKPLYWKDGQRLEWFEASGRGTVYSYVVAYEPFLPAFARWMPLVLVVVELAEGPRLVGHMVRCAPSEMRIGLPVRVVFRPLSERVVLPVWEPDR